MGWSYRPWDGRTVLGVVALSVRWSYRPWGCRTVPDCTVISVVWTYSHVIIRGTRRAAFVMAIAGLMEAP